MPVPSSGTYMDDDDIPTCYSHTSVLSPVAFYDAQRNIWGGPVEIESGKAINARK